LLKTPPIATIALLQAGVYQAAIRSFGSANITL